MKERRSLSLALLQATLFIPLMIGIYPSFFEEWEGEGFVLKGFHPFNLPPIFRELKGRSLSSALPAQIKNMKAFSLVLIMRTNNTGSPKGRQPFRENITPFQFE